jgi:hypothetical protein
VAAWVQQLPAANKSADRILCEVYPTVGRVSAETSDATD